MASLFSGCSRQSEDRVLAIAAIDLFQILDALFRDIIPHHAVVRRQGFWNRWLDDLAERLAHLFVDLKRLDCGIANAVV